MASLAFYCFASTRLVYSIKKSTNIISSIFLAVNCVADESSMSDNVLAVYVIIIIVLGSLFLVAVAAVVIIKTWLCNQK